MRKISILTAEEKLEILNRLYAGESNIKLTKEYDLAKESIRRWKQKFEEGGIEALESKTGKHSSPGRGNFTKKHFSSREEELEHKVMMLEIENARLKKGYLVKGDGAKKEFVTTLDVNMK